MIFCGQSYQRMSQSYGSGGTTEQIRGTVEQTNDKGVKVGGRWFNFSQYSKTTVRPAEGDEVELEVARGKFINDARIVSSGVSSGELLPTDGDAFPATDDDVFASPKAAAPRSAPPSRRTAPVASSPASDRNAEIRRQALIKAAAEYAAQRPELTPDDVLAIAAQWESWVVDAG